MPVKMMSTAIASTAIIAKTHMRMMNLDRLTLALSRSSHDSAGFKVGLEEVLDGVGES